MPPRVDHRRALRAAQDGRCWWCGLPMQLGDDGRHFSDYPWATTFEHLLPQGHPDHSQPWAIVGAHQFCNFLREAVEWDAFVGYVRGAEFAELYRRHRPPIPRHGLTKTLLTAAVRDIQAQNPDLTP